MQSGIEQTGDSLKDTADQNRSESTPLYLNVPDTGSLRLIVGFFIGFSITVTLALALQMTYGHIEVTLHGAVVSDSKVCSDVGESILHDGGGAVDAVIAVAFCMGVVNFHITGLGSGGYMLIYAQRERKLMNVIDFRVTRSNNSAIGVPGFVAGLALAHELYGTLPWSHLIKPAENFARNGFEVSRTLDKSASFIREMPHNENLRAKLSSLVLDEVITFPNLADTLNFIATSGSEEFYKNMLVNDVYGFIDAKDVLDYKALKAAGMKNSFLNYDITTPGQGSGGPLLLTNLKYINNSLSPLVAAVLGFKNVAENWKASTASHIAVVDNNDVYVTMVSGLGSIFGSQILTKSDYILNNLLEVSNDKEKQRPDVLFTPVFAAQKNKICGRRLLLGAGDVRDLVQALNYVLRNEAGNIVSDIEAPRVRIMTPKLVYDSDRKISAEDEATLSRETKFNFETSSLFPSINVIEKVNDTLNAHADTRGGGSAVVF